MIAKASSARQVCRFALLLGNLMLAQAGKGAGIPLTDVVLYGRVYNKTTHAQITGTLPGAITVKINSATGPTDPVIAMTSELNAAPGNVVLEYYVLRLPRFELGTSRIASDTFVLPGDRLHIYLNGTEVTETVVAAIQSTDATSDVRRLNLNAPITDTDNDGLPDSWEQFYFGNLNRGDTDVSGDGVSLLMSFAAGLNPNQNNSSKMPFLTIDQGNVLTFYFRQTTDPNALNYFVEASNSLSGNTWSTIPGVVPQTVTTDGTSRLLKVVVPGGVDRPRRFFRLNVSPQP